MAEQALVGGEAHTGALDLAGAGLAAEPPRDLAHLRDGLRGMASPKQAR